MLLLLLLGGLVEMLALWQVLLLLVGVGGGYHQTTGPTAPKTKRKILKASVRD